MKRRALILTAYRGASRPRRVPPMHNQPKKIRAIGISDDGPIWQPFRDQARKRWVMRANSRSNLAAPMAIGGDFRRQRAELGGAAPRPTASRPYARRRAAAARPPLTIRSS